MQIRKVTHGLRRMGAWVVFLLTGRGEIARRAEADRLLDLSGQGRGVRRASQEGLSQEGLSQEGLSQEGLSQERLSQQEGTEVASDGT